MSNNDEEIFAIACQKQWVSDTYSRLLKGSYPYYPFKVNQFICTDYYYIYYIHRKHVLS